MTDKKRPETPRRQINDGASRNSQQGDQVDEGRTDGIDKTQNVSQTRPAPRPPTSDDEQ